MDAHNYFIKEGYKNQKQNYTLSIKPEDLYWTEERIFFSQYFQYDVYVLAKKIIKKHELKNVVDVGCGVGTKLMKLVYPVCQDVTGIDQQEAIEFCKTNYTQGNFLVDDLEAPQIHHGPYDLVICSDVIEHLLNPDMLLEYIKKISHQKTYVIISTPERDILRGEGCMASMKPEHVREWNREEFKTYLTARGFNILAHKLSPFIKRSLKKEVFTIIRQIYKRAGTIKTNQLIVAKLT